MSRLKEQIIQIIDYLQYFQISHEYNVFKLHQFVRQFYFQEQHDFLFQYLNILFFIKLEQPKRPVQQVHKEQLVKLHAQQVKQLEYKLVELLIISKEQVVVNQQVNCEEQDEPIFIPVIYRQHVALLDQSINFKDELREHIAYYLSIILIRFLVIPQFTKSISNKVLTNIFEYIL